MNILKYQFFYYFIIFSSLPNSINHKGGQFNPHTFISHVFNSLCLLQYKRLKSNAHGLKATKRLKMHNNPK